MSSAAELVEQLTPLMAELRGGGLVRAAEGWLVGWGGPGWVGGCRQFGGIQHVYYMVSTRRGAQRCATNTCTASEARWMPAWQGRTRRHVFPRHVSWTPTPTSHTHNVFLVLFNTHTHYPPPPPPPHLPPSRWATSRRSPAPPPTPPPTSGGCRAPCSPRTTCARCGRRCSRCASGCGLRREREGGREGAGWAGEGWGWGWGWGWDQGNWHVKRQEPKTHSRRTL